MQVYPAHHGLQETKRYQSPSQLEQNFLAVVAQMDMKPSPFLSTSAGNSGM